MMLSSILVALIAVAPLLVLGDSVTITLYDGAGYTGNFKSYTFSADPGQSLVLGKVDDFAKEGTLPAWKLDDAVRSITMTVDGFAGQSVILRVYKAPCWRQGIDSSFKEYTAASTITGLDRTCLLYTSPSPRD